MTRTSGDCPCFKFSLFLLQGQFCLKKIKEHHSWSTGCVAAKTSEEQHHVHLHLQHGLRVPYWHWTLHMWPWPLRAFCCLFLSFSFSISWWEISASLQCKAQCSTNSLHTFLLFNFFLSITHHCFWRLTALTAPTAGSFFSLHWSTYISCCLETFPWLWVINNQPV